ncbi:MAG: hypothetical protein GEV08_11800 [Acidimicrobiia bacterium]|nr:hypothetical protein [Acidimicrobiia bacterium]
MRRGGRHRRSPGARPPGADHCPDDHGPDAHYPGGPADGGAATWFFSLTAASGTSGEGTLTLEGASPSVLALTDRPERGITRLPLADLVDGWADRFGDDPPNAVLTVVVDGEEHSTGVALSSPEYDAEADRLTFAAAPLPGETLPSWSFGLASVVIDSAALDDYELSASLGDQTTAPVAVDFGDTATIRAGDVQGEIIVEVAQSPLNPGYIKVVNDLDSTVGVTVTEDGVPRYQQELEQNGILYIES